MRRHILAAIAVFVVAGVAFGTPALQKLRELFANGTAALPALSFASDPDTGVYRVGTNSMGFSAGGALKAKVDSNGLTIGSSGSAISSTIAASRDYDAPSLANGYNHQFTITATGAAVGSPCAVGVATPSVADGGSAVIPAEASIRCQVEIANTVNVNIGNFGGDGGALDLPDAGYKVRVFNP